MEKVIRQVAEKEIGEIVGTLCSFLIGLMQENSPKEAEELFRKQLLSIGAKILGEAFERADYQIRQVIRERGHRDDQGCFCDGGIEGKGCKPITIQTILGEMQVNRWTGICKKCGKWIGSVEELLDVVNGMSAAAAHVVSLAGTLQPYNQSEDLLHDLVGIEIDDNRIQRTIISLSPRAEECMIQSFSGNCGVLPPAESTVYVMIDGGRIRMRENNAWREPVCALLMWADENGNWVKYGLSDPLHKEPVLTVLDEWLERLKIANPEQEVVIIADGAGWIWNWALKYTWAIKILDYSHLKEHVWKAARILYGEGKKETEDWVDTIMDRLWRGWVPSTIEMLKQMKSDENMGSVKRKALDKLVTYLKNHKGLIAYGKHRNAGRKIGSGSIESFCKQLFSMRMKGPGMFWSEEGAKAVMSLRTLYLTNNWDLLWQKPKPINCVENAA